MTLGARAKRANYFPAESVDPAQGIRPEVLAIEGLVRRFGEREAIAGVSATLRAGETLAVLGPNGAGKTTLLRVLATLLRPHAGRVEVLGNELPRDAHAVRPQVGLVGHEPLLYRELTARENLGFYARLYDVADAGGRVEELLARTGLTKRADEPVRSLSRGMVQRIAICRAVLHRPSLLLLDEPLAGLDPEAAELVAPLIGRPCGSTRVLVTHDIDRSLAEADRVLGLVDGRVAIEGEPGELSVPELLAIYGGR
jgi:heme ABC exporter ATP-binding subunit CcmA